MSPLPRPPKAVAVDRTVVHLAPKFREAVLATLAQLPDARLEETVRTAARQSFLYGFGRDYDDGRGVVTNASTALYSWHGYGLAADIVHAQLAWKAPPAWWRLMGEVAKAHGLDWGGDWSHADLPHVQWGNCKPSPSDLARTLYASGGAAAVWRAVGAA
jgi:hypothetical protein